MSLPTSSDPSPSLVRAFAQERKALQQQLSLRKQEAPGPDDLSPAQIVSEVRRSLDRAGDIFAQSTDDPALQKSGLWLLEMIKTGTGVLDQGTTAHVVWHETSKPWYKWQGHRMSGLFYAAAGLFALSGFVQGQGLVSLTACVLAALKFFDPKNWRGRLRLPFIKQAFIKQVFMQSPLAIEAASSDQGLARHIQAEARITANIAGFIDIVAESLNTADHILLRLSEPHIDTHWREDMRLMGLVQGLLEARNVQDGDFALKLVGQELESILAAEGVTIVHYTAKTQDLFDELPALDDIKTREAAPALMHGDKILRRGTIWRGV